MSKTVYFAGTLTKIANPEKKSLQERVYSLFTEQDKQDILEKKWDWQEVFLDRYGDEYVIIGDDIYKIDIESDESPPKDFFRVQRKPDGSIHFEVQYYNGGCGFHEALENAMEALTNDL